MSLNDFEILQKLGNEEKSSMFKVKRKKDGLIYILKTVQSQSLDKSEKRNLINEIKTVSSLSHPNIIEFKEAFFDKFSKSLNIIFEFPHNGNLSNKINYAIKNKMHMEESIIWDVLAQILNGVNYLHKKGIIHRNLKSKNILLNNQRLIKISDFETSCSFDKNNNMIIGQIGTPFYTAPEIWEEEPYNYKCDIWSIGCIIYEIASLTLPFKGNTINSLYESIMSKKIKPIPDFYSEDLKKIINYMLIFDPSKRPSTDLLLNYPRIKEESAKLKDIYIKYKINKNLRNSKNNVNTQIIKELTTDLSPNINRESHSGLKKPIKEKPQFNESLKNKNIYLKSIFPEKTTKVIKKDINNLYNSNLKKVFKRAIYKTLKERKEPNLSENKLNFAKCHSKKKENSSFNEFSNISTSRMQVPSLTQINKKVGLSSYSMNDTNINLILSVNNKLKNNLTSLTPNLGNKKNYKIIDKNEGENDYKPNLTNYNNINNISKFRTPSGNKGRYNLKKYPSINVNNISNNKANKNIIDNYIINNGNIANKSNKEIIMNYTKKNNVNLDYNRKVYNRTLSNKKVLMRIKVKKEYIDNNFPSNKFKDNNVSAYNRIKINDSYLKRNNKLDNGNCGNQSQLKMSSNNSIVKSKKSKPKYQKRNNIVINNVLKKKQFTKIHTTLPNNSNVGDNLSGIINLKSNSKLSLNLDEFINKNPINFNECQILSNNNKVIKYKNNLLDFKFDNKVNSYIMEINNTNYLQECEDISLNTPKNINHSKLNIINKIK